jgi:O-antigen/teichoic acid export membrane protein
VLTMIARNATANSMSTFVRLLIGFFITPLLIRKLGPETYGIWSFVSVFSITGYLTLLTLGIQGTLVRDLAKAVATDDRSRFRQLLSSAFTVYLVAGGIGAVVLLIMAQALQELFNVPESQVPAGRTLFVLLAVQTLIDFPSLTLDAVIEAHQRYGLRGALETSRFLAFAFLAVVALFSGTGVVALGWITLGISASAFIVLGIVLRASYPERVSPVVPARQTVVTLLRESASLFVIRLNAVIFQQMDRTILARLLTTTAITHYDIGARIYGFALIPQNLPASVILPTASAKVALAEYDELRRLFVSVTRYTAAVAVPLALGLFVLAGPFVRLWIGADYEPDAVYAQVFLVIAAFSAFNPVGYNTMIALGRIGPLARISIATTVLNLVLSVVLTLAFGILGVILGTAIGNAVAGILFIREYLGGLEVSLGAFARDVVLRGAGPAVIAAAVLLVATVIRPPSALVEVGAYLAAEIVLSLALYMLIAADATERARARRIVARLIAASAPL